MMFLCFSLQPFFSLISLVLIMISMQRIKIFYLYMIIILGSTYIGLINITKYPESDLYTYLFSFNQAKDLTFVNFMVLNSREPLYYALIFLIGNIPYVTENHFLFISSFLPYMIFLSAVLRLCLYLDLNRRLTILFLILLLFFPQLFNISAHLLRQFLASAICTHVIVSYLTTARARIMLAAAAFFIHFFVSLLFFLLIITRLTHSRRLPISVTYIGSITLMCAGIYVLQVVVSALPVPLMFAPLASRILNPAGSIDFSSLGVINYTFIFIIICSSIYNITCSKKFLRTDSFYIVHKAVITFCLMIIVSSFFPSFSEVTLRFSMLLYFISGIVLPYSYNLMDKKVYQEITALLAGVVILMFFVNSQNGTWQYAKILELLVWSPLNFWFYQAT